MYSFLILAISFRLILHGNGEKVECSLSLGISINARCVTYNNKKSTKVVRRVLSRSVSSQDENGENLACQYLCCQLTMFAMCFTLVLNENGEKVECSISLGYMHKR
jgi:hypothetical protein